MSGFQPAITINEAMQRIRDNEYLLPAFQREYVWKLRKIEELFDSLMRGYPTSSMLFWRVKDEGKTAWKFYTFLKYYRECYHTHNEFFETANHKDFYAILDGQQRLTSLYLALFGHYDIHRSRKRWENDDKNFQICDFYFNLTQSKKPENESVEYEFLWLDRQKTQEKDIFVDKDGQKWFKCKNIYKLANINEILEFSEENGLEKEERVRLGDFHTLIFNTKDESKINFYLEENQSPNKAVNIFIRINSNGEPLDYSDILFSIAIANWSNIDARTEINELVDRINQNFKISKDLILKGFLYLFNENIKFQIDSFDTNFIRSIEEKWEGIKSSFVETFKLLKSFGLNEKTLSSNNSVLPILYFIHHKNLTEKIVTSVQCKTNRELIRKWILRTIILKPFGRSGDTVLTNTRRAFVKDFKQNTFFDREIELFPIAEIEKEARYQKIDEEYLEDNVLYCRKNTPEAFAALSMLYPNLDYKNNNFHKDHLHPENSYKQYEQYGEAKHKEDSNYQYWHFDVYDSLVNLQMLDANENMSKSALSLEDWVNKNCGEDRSAFLKKHLIPNIDLSLENFDNFVEERKRILSKKLMQILNENL